MSRLNSTQRRRYALEIVDASTMKPLGLPSPTVVNNAPTTSSSVDGELNKLLLKQLECPVCFEYCSPPIFMCTGGHNTCSNCQKKLPICAVCRAKKPTTRNLALEELSVKVRRPCKNEERGCPDVFSLEGLRNHLPECKFTDVPCLIVHCNWKGPSSQLVGHVRAHHPNNYFVCLNREKYESVFKVGVANIGVANDVLLIEMCDEYFWKVIRYVPMEIALGFVIFAVNRDTIEKKSFRYELNVEGPDDSQKLSYRNDVKWVEGYIFSQATAPIFNINLLKMFADQNDKLEIRFDLHCFHSFDCGGWDGFMLPSRTLDKKMNTSVEGRRQI